VEHGDVADRGEPVEVWYADAFDVGHNAYEFKLDCGHGVLEEETVKIWLRVIASPSNARLLFRLLGTSLLEYADRFGPIDENGGVVRER
jgi:uncharacterized protein DUF3467